MSAHDGGYREGSLEAPTRHPVAWREPEFWDMDNLNSELERVYDICHGCRRCVSLCNAFPSLFDLVDEAPTMELDSVDKADYRKVVDQCYLCDLCYLTKCPYVPPHDWNVDFPHLMLRAKAIYFRDRRAPLRDRVLTSTDAVGKLGTLPGIAQSINAVNGNTLARNIMASVTAIHADAPLPRFYSNTARKTLAGHYERGSSGSGDPSAAPRLAVFLTCYGNNNAPDLVRDMITVFEHNGIDVCITRREKCCGMPKLELGDLETVRKLKEQNVPELAHLVDAGYELTAPIPSCVLMFKQELPLLFPDDEDVRKVQRAFHDPFEYLAKRHQQGKLNTDFQESLGKIAWHVACHQRVQQIGHKTKEILELVSDTEVTVLERCSGHDGTYAIKSENHQFARKICQPVVKRIQEGQVDHYVSDCPMAGGFIADGVGDQRFATSGFALLRKAYGI